MLQIIDDKIAYNYKLCQQCGVCEAVCSKQAITMKRLYNGLHEVTVDHDKCVRCQKCVKCCPANKVMGKGDYIKTLSGKRFFMGYNDDKTVRRASSSGGVCRTLVVNGLKEGIVDGVYTLKKLDIYPSGEGEFYSRRNIPDYDDLANSVYHSVMIGSNIKKVAKCDRLMIVGTACQLRALEVALKGKYKELLKVCIFCKQQKTLDSTRFLAKAMGTSIPQDLRFSVRYRGEGWQGIVRVRESQLPWNRAAGIPFGRRLWTVPGCNACGDPMGMECGADITLMDPWNIRTANELGETLVTVHTSRGMELLNSIPHLVVEEKSYEEIRPALDEPDIWRKRETVAYFRGEAVSPEVRRAGKAEERQRAMLEKILEISPILPFIFYRILNRLLPQKRNKILRYEP